MSGRAQSAARAATHTTGVRAKAARPTYQPTRGPLTPADRPKIIPGLDGLRALAIVSVLIYHLRPATLTGGFIGVDVFFVVSGFLITTLLLREVHASGVIDLKGFWLRRARRLLPALVSCVLVSVTAAFIVGGDLLVGIGRQALGALTFSNNWVEIVAGTSYFAGTSPQLFMNFWSLAVEEQFYLFWPILLAILLAATKSTETRVRLALGVAAVSAVWMGLVVTPGEDATRAYYGTDTHLFGLALGVALAFLWSRRSVLDGPIWHRWRVPASMVSLGVLFGLMATLSEDSVLTFRGGLFLACLATAILIAGLITGPHPLTGLAQSAPVRWIGERSYGIYLWHWPIILIIEARTAALAPDSGAWWILRGVALALILTIAATSYRYLETPVRRDGFVVCARRALRAVRGPDWRAKAVAATAAACAVVTPVAIALAPEKSETQLQIEAGQEHLDAVAEQSRDSAETQSPEAEATVSPEATPSPTASSAGTDNGVHDDGAGAGDTRIVSATLDTSVPAGEEISAFGDSMLVTSIHALEDRFPGISVDAKSNRQWPEGLQHIRSALDAGQVRRAVVIALGTNGGLPDPALLRDALDALGTDRLVVVVNLYGKSTWIPAVNEDFAAVCSEYANCAVAPWHEEIDAQRSLLQSDGVHPGITGAHLFADTIKDTFADLAARTSAAR